MSTVTVNNQKRPNLSDQIDRLDRILDGLADGLNDAVAGAVRDAVLTGVREAVTAVLSEVQTNEELRARLLATSAAPTPSPSAPVAAPATPVAESSQAERPSWWRRLCDHTRRTVARVWHGNGRVAAAAYELATGLLGRTASVATGVARTAWNHRLTIALAIGAGAVGGALYFIGGPFVVAAWTWAASTAAILLGKAVGVWERLWLPAISAS